MTLFKIKRREVNRFKFALYFAFLAVLAENLFYFRNRFEINQGAGIFTITQNIVHIVAEGLLAVLILMLVLFLCGLINRYLLKTIAILILIVSGAFVYYVIRDKLIIDSLFIGALMEPDQGEAAAVFSFMDLVFWLIFGILPALYILLFIKIKKLNPNYLKLYTFNFWLEFLKPIIAYILIPSVVIIAVILTCNSKLIIPVKLVKRGAYIYMPLNYISGGYSYFSNYLASKVGNEGLIDIYKKYPFSFEGKLKNQPLTVVLIIGESARAKNEHYEGYKRNTNYYTEHINNIIYFKHMMSCGTFTRWSVPCIVSRMGHEDFRLPIKETNLVSVFGNLGFKTWWISSQTSFVDSKDHNRVLGNLVSTADVQYFASSLYQSTSSNYDNYDGLLFRFLDVALKDKAKQKFIVLHIRGSHFIYTERVPQAFKKFKGCTPNKCNDQLTEADYDNTLLYTDWFISQVIKRISSQKSLLIYASDHGESLGVDHSGYLMHGAPYNTAPLVQKHVAALMWFSKSFKQEFPREYNNAKNHADKSISHDYIFHSLFNCLGVKSSAVKSNLSLCTNNTNK